MEVYVRRVNGVRRALVTDSGNKEIIEEILHEYRENDELGTVVQSDEDYEKLRDKEVAGEPGTSHKGKMMKQCRPTGQVGYLLETLHLKAPALGDKKTICPYNQHKTCTSSASQSAGKANGRKKSRSGPAETVKRQSAWKK